MYAYDSTNTPSLSFQQTLTLAPTASAINDVALYNRDDSHIYLAIATQNNVQIYGWDGTVTPSGVFTGLGYLATSSAVNTLAWWVDTTNPTYAAYLATADVGNNVTIYGLSQTYTFNYIDHVNTGSTPFTNLLWYVQTDNMGYITLLDLIGGSTSDAHEYTINVNITDKTITATTQNTIPYPVGGLSTCNTFLAIGDYGAPTSTGAAVRLYDVDSGTGTINKTASIITDTSATNIYYLAKCCAGDPEYLLAGIGNATNYTFYVLDPTNLNIVTKQTLGTRANSVAWCCNGINSYLAVTYQDAATNQAGNIYQLNMTPTSPLINLGPIKY